MHMPGSLTVRVHAAQLLPGGGLRGWFGKAGR
jgi:hypothetical protein